MSIGIDLVQVDRMEKSIQNPRFIEKVFTEKELAYLEKRKHHPQTAAGLFAAKEAVTKVLGTGISGFGLRAIGIHHDEKGKPHVELSSEAQHFIEDQGYDRIDVSITHEMGYAVAVAEGKYDMEQKQKYLIIPELIQSLLKRDKNAHKGHYGKVGVVGGSLGMSGSVYMTSKAALRTGSGLVYSIVPKSLGEVMSIKSTEAIIRPIEDEGKGHFVSEHKEALIEAISDLDALCIGPGMGRSPDIKELTTAILENFKKPIIVDADALNALSGDLSVVKRKRQPIILTPHTMEMSRITGLSVKDIENNRVSVAQSVAEDTKVTVLLKGNETIIAEDDMMYYVNSTGNPGMATAGSGDVLSGVITSLLGQGYTPLLSTRLGAYIHGIAGDMVAEKMGYDGMVATDILEQLPYALKFMRDVCKNEML